MGKYTRMVVSTNLSPITENLTKDNFKFILLELGDVKSN